MYIDSAIFGKTQYNQIDYTTYSKVCHELVRKTVFMREYETLPKHNKKCMQLSTLLFSNKITIEKVLGDMNKFIKIALIFLILSLILCTFQISHAANEQQRINITVDGHKVDIDLTTDDMNLYVPAEKIYKALDARYNWNLSNKQARIQYGAKSFTIGEQDYELNVNGKVIQFVRKPYLEKNVLMIPLITAVESVGGGLEWEEETKTWKVYSRNLLEATVDIMGDGTSVKDRLANYEKYFNDGKYIFWSSLRDGASLYRSDSDGKNLGRVIDAATDVIGIDTDFVYFINISQGNYIYRIKKDGTSLQKLADDTIESAWLEGDTVRFYSKSGGLYLYSISKDGSVKKKEPAEITVMDEDWVVSGNETISDRNILLKGNLIINTAASLTLNNVNLVIDTGNESGQPVERNINVDSSSISVKNSRLSSTHPDGGIIFKAVSSKVDIESSSISGMKEQLQLTFCDNSIFMDNYIIDSAGNGVILPSRSKNLLFKNNTVINKTRGATPFITIQAGWVTGAEILDNVFVDQGECIFFTQMTDKGRAMNNLIFGDDEALCLSLRHDAGNNTYYNNFIQQNYDDGYRITNGLHSNGILSDTLDATTVFEKNVINNAKYPIVIANLKNCVYDSNRVWLQLLDDKSDRTGNKCMDIKFSHNCEIINNTFTSWLGENGSGIQMFYSSENRIEGNTFKGFKYGLELWNGSDSNDISGNHITDCLSYILIDGSNQNKMINNSLISNKKVKIYAYNNGKNDWASNFYSNSSPNEPHILYGLGSDGSPLRQSSALIAVQRELMSKTFVPYDPANINKGNLYINSSETWKDKTIDYDWHYVRIKKGGTLTLENITLRAPVSYNSEPEIGVEDGGTLILKNSKILADPYGMPFSINISDGGRIIAENCTFEYMPAFEIMSSANIIKNCTFINCYDAPFFWNNNGQTIQNCKITNSFHGLYIENPTNCRIDGNTENNIVMKSGSPVQVPALDDKNRKSYRNKPSTWSEVHVNSLKKYALADDYFFREFDRPVERQELAAILVKIYEYVKKEKIDDPNRLSYIDTYYEIYKNEIEKASSIKVISGYSSTKGQVFNPKGTVTRQEACVMIYRLITNLEKINNPHISNNVRFRDDTKIAGWAKTAVMYCYEKGIVSGQGDKMFTPLGEMTREQLIAILGRYLTSKGVI